MHQLSAAQGASPSEWIRDVIFRAVYGEPLGIAEGYLHGRAIGYRLVRVLIQRMLNDVQAPETVEEGMSLLQSFNSPGRTPHEG